MGIHQKNNKTLKINEYHRKISFPAPARIHDHARRAHRPAPRIHGLAQLRAYTAPPSSARTLGAALGSSLCSSLCSSVLQSALQSVFQSRSRAAASIRARPPSFEHKRGAAQSRAYTRSRPVTSMHVLPRKVPRSEVRGPRLVPSSRGFSATAPTCRSRSLRLPSP